MRAGRITINGNDLTVEAPPHVSIRLRRLFAGAQRQKAGTFKLSASPAVAYDLDWFMLRHPLEIDPGSAARFRELVEAQTERLAQLAQVDQDGYVPREFDLKLPPREYQRFAADVALKTGRLLIADEVGLGKTVTSICALTAPGALPALVVTMTHLARQWERELERFLPGLAVHRVTKGQPYKLSAVKLERDASGRRAVKRGIPDVIIINYHKLNGWVETLAGLCQTVIFDEAQELRHDGPLKYKAAEAIAAEAILRIQLTATPIYNYGAEVFNVVNVIAPGALGTRAEFLSEWCGESRGDDDRKARVSDPAALGTYLREQGLMLRRTRKDVGRELPAVTSVRHVVECDPGGLNAIADDVAELAKRVLARIGTPTERMQQAGELDWRMRQATGIAKAPAVAEFVRLLVESGEKVVLFGWHIEVYEIWKAAFDSAGITYAMYTGQQTEAQKDESRRRFIDGDAQVIIISLRSGAGLDGLQFVCRNVVNGELDWSPGVHHQGGGRVHRDGQADPVMIYFCVAEEGSDPVIWDVLGIKDAQAQGIVDPGKTGVPELTGASDDHIRKLAEAVLKRRESASGK